tara:strand:- start:216 stop:395 length:180 start_codon:yes stop_codon:yes gene_type:complete
VPAALAPPPPPDLDPAAQAPYMMDIDGKNQDTERQHPETENGEKSHDPAKNEHNADRDA